MKTSKKVLQRFSATFMSFKFTSFKFTTRFLLLVLAAAVVPAACIGYALSVVNLTTLKNISRDYYLSVAQHVQDHITSDTEKAARLLAQITNLLNNNRLQEEAVLQYATELIANTNAVEAVALYGAKGELIEVFARSNTGKTHIRNAAKRYAPEQLPPALADALRRTNQGKNTMIVGEVQKILPDGLPCIPIVARWEMLAGQTGAIVGIIGNEHLCGIVENVSVRSFLGARNYVVLANDSLAVVAAADRSRVTHGEMLAGKGMFEEVRLENGRVSAQFLGLSAEFQTANGEAMVGTYSALPLVKSIVIVEQPQDIAYKSVFEMREKILWWTFASGIVTMILAYILVRQFSKPMEQLVAASETMTRYDFSVRLPERRGDEFAVLFAAHNRTAQELGRFYKLNVDALVVERNKLEMIVRQATDGIMVIDEHGTILLVNDIFCRWFAVNMSIEGLSVHNIFAKTALSEAFEHIMTEHIVKSSVPDHTDERNSPKAAHPLEISVGRSGEIHETVLRGATAAVLVDAALSAVVIVLHDVTKEVQTDRLKTELVGIVAHELRSPLNSMQGLAELIAEGIGSPEETIEYGYTIASQAKKLNGVITKFLDLNRIESGKADIENIPFKLDDVVKSVLKVNTRLAEKKNIRILTKFPSKLPPVVGDPDLIGQAFLNLFSNAVKYSDSGKTVEIEIVEKADEITLRVRDEGYGISASSQEKLFTKFFRATDDSRVKNDPGTGLGLAFVKEIVEKHGGTVGVESTVHQGSTFWLSVPK